MKILRSDFRKGFVKLKIESLEDLWYLSHVIDNYDVVLSETYRKIKLGEGSDEKTKIIKKRVWLSLSVEKIQFSEDSSILRVSGKITEGKEDIPAGEYHTFSIETGSQIEIQKPKGFLDFQIKRINEAVENKSSSIMICVVDRDSAIFSLLKKYGYDIVSKLSGNVQKKQFDEKNKNLFFSEIVSLLKEYKLRYSLTKIIIGSPNFWKQYLSSEIDKTDLSSIVIYSGCSDDGENAIKEILKRPETETVLKDERFSKEMVLIDRLLSGIAKDSAVEYGFEQVKKVSELGAVEDLLVSDNLIQKVRDSNEYESLDYIMRIVDNSKGKIHILSSRNEAGEKLDSLGGIAAFLRFRV